MTKLVGTYVRPNTSKPATVLPSVDGQEAFCTETGTELIADSSLKWRAKDNVLDVNTGPIRASAATSNIQNNIIYNSSNSAEYYVKISGTDTTVAGGIYRTTDSGASWTTVIPPGTVTGTAARSSNFMELTNGILFAQIGSAHTTATTNNRLISYNGSGTAIVTTGENLTYTASEYFNSRYFVLGISGGTGSAITKISTGTGTNSTGWTTYNVFANNADSTAQSWLLKYNSDLVVVEWGRPLNTFASVKIAKTTSGTSSASWSQVTHNLPNIIGSSPNYAFRPGVGYIDGVQKLLIYCQTISSTTNQTDILNPSIYYNSDSTLTTWVKHMDGFDIASTLSRADKLIVTQHLPSYIVDLKFYTFGQKTFLITQAGVKDGGLTIQYEKLGILNLQTKKASWFQTIEPYNDTVGKQTYYLAFNESAYASSNSPTPSKTFLRYDAPGNASKHRSILTDLSELEYA